VAVRHGTRTCEDGDVGSHDDGEPDVDASSTAPDEDQVDAPGFDRWRRESALGGLGTGVARGLQAVFAPPVDEVVIVASAPGDPPDADERVRVILDPDDPTRSVAIMPRVPSDPPAG
jgi:hypothetical protein